MRLTVPSRKLLTHTAPPPAASRSGESPTLIVAVTLPVAGSTASTLSAPEAATQRSPFAVASPTGASTSGTQWRRLSGPSRGAVGPGGLGFWVLLFCVLLPQAARVSTAT